MAHSTEKSVTIPTTYEGAKASEYSKEWSLAMDDEMASVNKNEVFDVMPAIQATKKPVGSKWVNTVKYKKNDEIEKFKARIVAKGYSQVYCIDYLKTFCSIVQIMTTRLVQSFAAVEWLEFKQFDIKTAFLYGTLEEQISMKQPKNLRLARSSLEA